MHALYMGFIMKDMKSIDPTYQLSHNFSTLGWLSSTLANFALCGPRPVAVIFLPYLGWTFLWKGGGVNSGLLVSLIVWWFIICNWCYLMVALIILRFWVKGELSYLSSYWLRASDFSCQCCMVCGLSFAKRLQNVCWVFWCLNIFIW